MSFAAGTLADLRVPVTETVGCRTEETLVVDDVGSGSLQIKEVQDVGILTASQPSILPPLSTIATLLESDRMASAYATASSKA